jgi:hypothetical protein
VHRVPNTKLLAVVGRNSSVIDFAAGRNLVSKLFTARALQPLQRLSGVRELRALVWGETFEQIAGFKWMKKGPLAAALHKTIGL